jgi:hypothetical protein
MYLNQLQETLKSSQGGRETPFYCHIYSNNGLWVYADLLKRGGLQRVPSKIILDSSPFLWYEEPKLLQQAKFLTPVLTSSFLKKQIYHHPVFSPLIRTSLVLFLSFSKIIAAIQKVFPFIRLVPDFLDLNKYLLEDAPLPAEGFLMVYSSGDKLVPIEQVLDFQNRALLRRGAKVETFLFGDDVGHTSAFFLHTEVYKQKVDQFFGLGGRRDGRGGVEG